MVLVTKPGQGVIARIRVAQAAVAFRARVGMGRRALSRLADFGAGLAGDVSAGPGDLTRVKRWGTNSPPSPAVRAGGLCQCCSPGGDNTGPTMVRAGSGLVKKARGTWGVTAAALQLIVVSRDCRPFGHA